MLFELPRLRPSYCTRYATLADCLAARLLPDMCALTLDIFTHLSLSGPPFKALLLFDTVLTGPET